VRTETELQAMITKTLELEAVAHGRSAVFAADDSDAQGPFTTESERLISMLPPDWQVTRAFLDELPVGEARSVLTGAINEGAMLTTFVGHSGPASWTFDGLLTAEDVETLTNDGLPTVVVQWGCWNTYHVQPEFDTMAHRFMLFEDRGAAVVTGATTITDIAGDALLGPSLQEQLLTPGTPVGVALQIAKDDLAQSRPNLGSILLGWTLLGDPGVVLVD
jgi:hypothetical protein